MFVLNDPPPPVDPALLETLSRAEPATIGHFRHTGFMDPGIRGLLPDRRIAGTAVTCRCYGADTTIVHYALGQLRPGDILVHRPRRRPPPRRGAAAASPSPPAPPAASASSSTAWPPISRRSADTGMPVWARGLSAVTGKRTSPQGDFCIPVSCGGVAVEPGDAILADENGVLVLKPHEITEAAERAIGMQESEKKTLARITAGERLPDINGTNARIRELMAAKKSPLTKPFVSTVSAWAPRPGSCVRVKPRRGRGGAAVAKIVPQNPQEASPCEFESFWELSAPWAQFSVRVLPQGPRPAPASSPVTFTPPSATRP